MSLSLLIALLTILLPFTALGQKLFGFEQTDLAKLITIFAIVFGYFITTDLVKLFYLHFMGNGNSRKHKHVRAYKSRH